MPRSRALLCLAVVIALVVLGATSEMAAGLVPPSPALDAVAVRDGNHGQPPQLPLPAPSRRIDALRAPPLRRA